MYPLPGRALRSDVPRGISRFGLAQGGGGQGRPGSARNFADEDIVRFARSLGRIAFVGSLLGGTVVRTRIDKKAPNISVLAAIGVRRDGQKVLLSIRGKADRKTVRWTVFPPNGGESTAAWRQFLNDLDARGLTRPEL